jgi:hypothetical protein
VGLQRKSLSAKAEGLLPSAASGLPDRVMKGKDHNERSE